MTNLRRWSLIAALSVAAVVLLISQDAKREPSVSVEEAHRLIEHDSTVIVLDVRTPEEFTGPLGHVDHALLIPIQELEQRIKELDDCKNKTILAICRTGRRSAIATEILKKKGFHVFNVEGGMTKWNEKGYSAVKEK